eukprot:COSAG01_NODE_6142_length_3826_cov_13.629461_4_plen_53_part_00
MHAGVVVGCEDGGRSRSRHPPAASEESDVRSMSHSPARTLTVEYHDKSRTSD